MALLSSDLHGADTRTANATYAQVRINAITKRTDGRPPPPGGGRRVIPPSRAPSGASCCDMGQDSHRTGHDARRVGRSSRWPPGERPVGTLDRPRPGREGGVAMSELPPASGPPAGDEAPEHHSRARNPWLWATAVVAVIAIGLGVWALNE